MNKHFLPKNKGLILFGLQIISTIINATDFREPLTLNNGPLRFLFESEDDKISARWWSGAYNRYANKTFNEKLGRNFLELPALLFGKSEFRVSELFPNCLVDMATTKYNPLLKTTNFRLRANYNEVGCAIGFNFDYPFYSNTGSPGRFGIRGSVPFKRCWVDKIDTGGVKSGAELQDLVAVRPMRYGLKTGTTDTKKLSGNAVMIRLDLLEALISNSGSDPLLKYLSTISGHSVKQAGTYDIDINPEKIYNDRNNPLTDNLAKQSFGIVYSPEGEVPSGINNFIDPTIEGLVRSLPATGSIKDSSGYYVFDEKIDYSIFADDADKDIQERLADQETKATLWAIPIAYLKKSATDSELQIVDGPLNSAKLFSDQISENVYDWFYSTPEKINFESYHVEHIGDARLELFAQQTFSDRLMIEISGTMVIPTGGKNKYRQNPYQMSPGNGGHWEIAPGAMMATKFNDYITLKADGKYFFVLNAIEERAACFSGAQVKNIGPRVDANVKWRYFTGNVDINITHPKTNSVTGLIGYQFNFKHKDVLKYTVDKIESWLGKSIDVDGVISDNKYALDEKLAVQYTDSISHRLRIESSILLSGWAEFYCGGGWTFLGKNTPATVDGYAGFHISF